MVKDQIAALLERGVPIHFEVPDVAVHDLDSDRPRLTYGNEEIVRDFIAGCGGLYGVCRPSILDRVLTRHEFDYPFGWLGILAEAPPSTDELIYAWHENGFALHSMRSPKISRLYLQARADERLEEWPDERRLQLARLEYLTRSSAAATSLAENYVGLPAATDF